MEAQEPILSARGVHYRYTSREILKGVDLAIHPGDRLGVVGANGAGKSTLLKLMAGLEAPDAGEVVKQRGLRIGYLPQDFALDPATTVLEAVQSGAADTLALRREYDALSARLAAASGAEAERLLAEQAALAETLEHQDAWHLETRLANVMQRLGVVEGSRLTGSLSGGEARRVSLARALVARPDLLILDEPTNHLDAATIAWLEKFLADYPGAVLLITHDRYFLDRVANRIIELEHGELQNYSGDYSDYLEAKAARLAGMAAAESARQNTLRRELAWVRKQPRARQAKSKSREEAYYALLADVPPPGRDEIQLRIPQGPVRLGKKVVDLLGVTKRQGGKLLFENLTLKLAPGDRIGVIGPNGAGKTTLMRLVQGLDEPDVGTVEIGPTARFVYADQGRSRIDLAKTLVEELAAGGTHVTVDEEERLSVRNYLRRFLFTDDQQSVPMHKFSGGEQNRAQLAKLLAVGGNVLIFDEPTNDLDLPTLRALEDALAVFPGCAFVVSHDRYFLNRVATGILAFEGDGVVRYEVGNYDRYLEVKAREEAEAAAASAPSKAAPAPVAAPKASAKKLSYKETQELAGMEEAILEAETRLAELEAALGDPALYAERPGEVAALTAETEAQRARVEELYARWEALEALKAGV